MTCQIKSKRYKQVKEAHNNQRIKSYKGTIVGRFTTTFYQTCKAALTMPNFPHEHCLNFPTNYKGKVYLPDLFYKTIIALMPTSGKYTTTERKRIHWVPWFLNKISAYWIKEHSKKIDHYYILYFYEMWPILISIYENMAFFSYISGLFQLVASLLLQMMGFPLWLNNTLFCRYALFFLFICCYIPQVMPYLEWLKIEPTINIGVECVFDIVISFI